MKKIFFFLFSLIFTLSIVATPALAQERKPQNIVLPENQVIDSDYFNAGDNVTVLGTINGDAYVAGGNVTFNGIVNGDIIAAGGTITVNGSAQNVRVAGGNITVNGKIEKNLTVFGGNITLGNNASLLGSIVAAGGSINLAAPVGRGATILGGNVIVGNLINGNTYAAVGQLTLQPQAMINGNLVYVSDQPAQLLSGSKVSGKLTHTLPQKPKENSVSKLNAIYGIGIAALTIKLIGMISLLIIGWIIIGLAPHYVKKVADGIVEKPWQTFATGLVAMILAPVIFFILLATVVGIPLAFIFAALFCITVFISKLFVMFLIGEKLAATINPKMPLGLAFFIGVVIYGVVAIIPVFGWLADILAIFFGLGSLLIQKKQIYQSLRKDKTL